MIQLIQLIQIIQFKGVNMKKIKLLFIILLLVMLSGCSLFQLEFGMNVNDFRNQEIPRMAMGIKSIQSKEILYDLNYINLELHYGSNGDFSIFDNEELDYKFVGCILLSCTLDQRDIEFTKTQTEYNYLGNIECFKLGNIGDSYLTGPTIKVDGEKVDYKYYTQFYVDSKNIIDKEGKFCIQLREVLYNKIDNYFYTGDVFEIILAYQVKSNNKVELSFVDYTYKNK